jgi:hypothetical protein
MTAVYETKRDAWITALIWGGALLSAYAGFAQFENTTPLLLRVATLILLVSVAGFMLWVLYRTDYTLTDKTLLIRCGPFRYRVPLVEIDSVRPSRNPLSSPACSLDRVSIKWNGERKRILISPSEKAKFLRELGGRCPQLRPEGEGLVRQ